MYEIRVASNYDLMPLAIEVAKEGELRGFELKDFEEILRNESALLLHYAQSAFCYFQFAKDEADLIEVWCSPQLRRRGIGRSLLTQGIIQLKQSAIQNCFLEVAIDNTGAISLYECLGFKAIGTRRQYYARNNGSYIDAINMKLETKCFEENIKEKKCT